MIDLFKDQILFIIAVADEIFDDLQSSVKGETDIFFWIKSALIDISACASHGLCNDSGLNKLCLLYTSIISTAPTAMRMAARR